MKIMGKRVVETKTEIDGPCERSKYQGTDVGH